MSKIEESNNLLKPQDNKKSLDSTFLNFIKAMVPSLIPTAIIFSPVHSLISSFSAFVAGVIIVGNNNFFNPENNKKEKSQKFFKKIGGSLYTNLPALIPLMFMCKTSLPLALIAAPAVVASYGSCKSLIKLVKNSFINISNKNGKVLSKSITTNTQPLDEIKQIKKGENKSQKLESIKEVVVIKELIHSTVSDPTKITQELIKSNAKEQQRFP